MAFLPVYDRDEEDAQKRAAPQSPGFALSPATGGGFAPPSQPQSGGDTSQGKFVNFERYIAANKDAATRTGSGLADDAAKGAEASRKALGTAQQNFGSAVAAGSPFGAPQKAAPRAFGDGGPRARGQVAPTGGAGMTAFGQMTSPADYKLPQVSAPPVGAQGTGQYGVAQQGMEGTPQIPGSGGQTDFIGLDEAKKRAESVYTGPTSLSQDEATYDSLMSGARDAQGNLDNLGSLAGQDALLREKYGKQGGYTAGQSNFDAGLTNATSRGRFDQLRGQYGDLAKVIEEANAASMREAGGARDYTQGVADRYASAYGDAAGQQQSKLGERNQRIEREKLLQRGGQLLKSLNSNWKADIDLFFRGKERTGAGSRDVEDIGAKEAQLRAAFDAQFGPGSWDAMKAAKGGG